MRHEELEHWSVYWQSWKTPRTEVTVGIINQQPQATLCFDGHFKENCKSWTRWIHLQSCPKACQGEGLEGWQAPQLPEVRALSPEPEGLCPQHAQQSPRGGQCWRSFKVRVRRDCHSYLTLHTSKWSISVWRCKDTWNRSSFPVFKVRCELAAGPNGF